MRVRVDGRGIGAGIELHIDAAITAVATPMAMMRDRRGRVACIATLVAACFTATGSR